MAKSISSLIKQWQALSHELRKTVEETPKLPVSNVAAEPTVRQKNNEHITAAMQKMHEYSKDPSQHPLANEISSNLHKFVMEAPKGSIDIGELNHQREQLPDVRNRHKEIGKPYDTQHMEEAINHHLSDIKSIKDAHDNYGGENTVKALLHTWGANGTPKMYANLHFKRHNIIHDLNDLVAPGSPKSNRSDDKDFGVLPHPPWHKTPTDPELDQKARDAEDAFMSYDENDVLGYDDPVRSKAYNNAVVDRGWDLFKRHYKL